jgi:hypothetical protein
MFERELLRKTFDSGIDKTNALACPIPLRPTAMIRKPRDRAASITSCEHS